MKLDPVAVGSLQTTEVWGHGRQWWLESCFLPEGVAREPGNSGWELGPRGSWRQERSQGAPHPTLSLLSLPDFCSLASCPNSCVRMPTGRFFTVVGWEGPGPSLGEEWPALLTCGVAVGSQPPPPLSLRCRWDLLAAQTHPSLLHGKDQRDGNVEDTPGGTRDDRSIRGPEHSRGFTYVFPHVGPFGMNT